MLAGKDVTRAPHVGRELINLVKAPVDQLPDEISIAEIADHEVVSLGFTKSRELEIGGSDPETLSLQAPHQMMTDKAARSTD